MNVSGNELRGEGNDKGEILEEIRGMLKVVALKQNKELKNEEGVRKMSEGQKGLDKILRDKNHPLYHSSKYAYDMFVYQFCEAVKKYPGKFKDFMKVIEKDKYGDIRFGLFILVYARNFDKNKTATEEGIKYLTENFPILNRLLDDEKVVKVGREYYERMDEGMKYLVESSSAGVYDRNVVDKFSNEISGILGEEYRNEMEEELGKVIY